MTSLPVPPARPVLRTVSDDGWPDPRPPSPLPPWPALPGVVGAYAAAVAEALQVPAAFTAPAALTVVSAATRGRWAVAVAPGWVETLALYTAPLLDSGHRKSPAVAELTRPLVGWERDRRAAAGVEHSQAVERHELARRRLEAARKIAARDGGPDTLADLDAAAAEVLDTVPDPLPRLLVDDVTPERLARMLGDHGAIAHLSTEGGLVSSLAGRYSNGTPNLDAVLKSWAGEPFSVDRISSDTARAERPFLALCLATQPDVLREMKGERAMTARGLLARFLVTLPAPLLGWRDLDPPPVPAALTARWDAAVRRVLDTDPVVDHLTLTAGASARLAELRAEVERDLRPGAPLSAGLTAWGSKLPGQLVRVAACLELADDPAATVVDEPAMTAAAGLHPVLAAHARRAFLTVDRPPALRILDTLIDTPNTPNTPAGDHEEEGSGGFGGADLGSDVTTTRDLWQRLRDQAWCRSTDDVRQALEHLEARGWVRRLPAEAGRPGRPSERWQLHPRLADHHGGPS